MKRARVYRTFDLILPDHIAEWDVLDYWERRRWGSMFGELAHDSCLWVAGAEHGFVAATYAQITDALVLIEPEASFWPNLRLTWEYNEFPGPVATVRALLADDAPPIPPGRLPWIGGRGAWPAEANGPESGARAYRYLHEPHDDVPVTTIDRLVAAGITPPAGLSLDVEGAELTVLRGAEATLDRYRPAVWLSIHPDLAARDYGVEPHAEVDWLAARGYVGTHLGTDHEEHWRFLPDERISR